MYSCSRHMHAIRRNFWIFNIQRRDTSESQPPGGFKLSLSWLLPWRGERNGLCMINSLIFSTSSSSSSSGINIISIYFKILLQHQIRRSRTYSVPFIVDRIMTRFNSTLHNVIELGYIVIPCGYLTGCHRWSGMRPID